MKSSDIQNLSYAYEKLITEDVGLGGHVAGTNFDGVAIGVQFPDNISNQKSNSNRSEINIKTALEELKSISQDLKNVNNLEPWIVTKLNKVSNHIDLIYNYLTDQNR